MKRIFLFLATNLAIFLVLNIAQHLLGVGRILAGQGANLGLNALRIFAAVLGFGGPLISLAVSKWTAKCMVGARVIGTPHTPGGQWPMAMVRRQAEPAGIGMPGVGIDAAPDMNAFATGASRNNALVAVSTALLDRLRREEVAATRP